MGAVNICQDLGNDLRNQLWLIHLHFLGFRARDGFVAIGTTKLLVIRYEEV